jgi:tetratricopeptide (TPR) repeat protein
MAFEKSLLLSSLSLAVVLAGCSNVSHHMADAEAAIGRADWLHAWDSIQQAREAAPGDPAVEAAYWRVRKLWLLERARSMIFANRDADALAELEKVLTLDPEEPTALAWRQKAIEKLAIRATDQGDELARSGKLEDALLRYNEALGFIPGDERATTGLEELGEVWSSNRQRARLHFLDGLRAGSDNLSGQSLYHLRRALELDPGLEEARAPLAEAERRVQEDLLETARDMIERGSYHGAKHAIESAPQSMRTLPGVEELLSLANAEIEVNDLRDDGQIALARGELTVARAKLEAAFEKSAKRREQIGEMLLALRGRELEAEYLAAKDLELLGSLDAAIEAYAKLDARSPSYRDVRDRTRELKVRVEEAKKAYDLGIAAQEAGQTEAALTHFADVLLYWTNYRDVAERIASLRQSREPSRN